MAEKISRSMLVDIKLYEPDPAAPSGTVWKWVSYRCAVQLDIDAETLAKQLAAKAAKNKSGRARTANGAVVLKLLSKAVTNRREY